MAWDSAVVTNAGITLLNEVVTGKKMMLDYATLGNGTVPEESLMLQTGVTGELHQAEIVDCKNMNDTGQRVHILISNQGLETGFYMRQLGIWAHLQEEEDAAPVLIAIIQDSHGNGLYVPGMDEIADFSLDFYAAIAFQWTGTFSVTVDPSTLVTVATLQEALENIAGSIQTVNERIGKAFLTPVTTGGDGTAYTATIPGFETPEKGSIICIIPHAINSVSIPTLSINGGKAHQITRFLSNSTSGTTSLEVATMKAGYATLLRFGGNQWTVLGPSKPYAPDLSGIVPIANGGTGANTAEVGFTNLLRNTAFKMGSNIDDYPFNSDFLVYSGGSTGGPNVFPDYHYEYVQSRVVKYGATNQVYQEALTGDINDVTAYPRKFARRGCVTDGESSYSPWVEYPSVIEQGTSGYWEYRIWNSGIKEAWLYAGYGVFEFSCTAQKGALYYSDEGISIAAPFKMHPTKSLIFPQFSNGGSYFIGYATINSTTNSVRLKATSYQSGSVSPSLMVYIRTPNYT